MNVGMSRAPVVNAWRRGTKYACGVVLAGLVSVGAPAAQLEQPLELPPGPSTARGFDLARLNTENYGAFLPFHVTDTRLLSRARQDGTVADDTRVLVTDTAAGPLALLTDQMSYHHVAQGRAGGKDWLATF